MQWNGPYKVTTEHEGKQVEITFSYARFADGKVDAQVLNAVMLGVDTPVWSTELLATFEAVAQAKAEEINRFYEQNDAVPDVVPPSPSNMS